MLRRAAGMAGAIPPLLHLAGDRRRAGSTRRSRPATARCRRWPRSDGARGPLGRRRAGPTGSAGSRTAPPGIGWALARLGRPATGAHAGLAAAAFAYEETLYGARRCGGWRDRARAGADRAAATWVPRRAAGSAWSAADLLRRTGDPRMGGRCCAARRPACWAEVIELEPHALSRRPRLLGDMPAAALGTQGRGAGRGGPGAAWPATCGSVSEHGPVCRAGRDAFTPGLLPGVGGMAYQLVRWTRTAGPPSVLVPDCRRWP